jgi:N-acetylneuraminic acid mutarotase
MLQIKSLWLRLTFVVAMVLGFGLANARDLTFDERFQAQKAIEEVYWRHRIWPKDNPTPKPSLDAVMPASAIRAKVEDSLAKSNALQRLWKYTVTGDQLQAEMDRMAKQTANGEILQDLFHALGGDPSLVAETLARQTLVDRLIRNWYASDTRFHGKLKAKVEAAVGACTSVGSMKSMGGEYREVVWTLPSDKARGPAEVDVAEVSLDPDEWEDHVARLASKLGAPADALPTGRLSGIEETRDAFVVTAVLAQRDRHLVTASVTWPKRTFEAWWEEERAASGTGTALASGVFTLPVVPLTTCTNDTWRPTLSPIDGRYTHAAVWTGSEMIVWGGYGSSGNLRTGGRYNPATDSWTQTSTGANVPTARSNATAVWTGTQMIVWGGSGGSYLKTGGRYDPATDSWTATSTGANVPTARQDHTAVWTGTQMIVWGGYYDSYLNTGGRYDPVTDTWTPTSTGANLPAARMRHTAVWTGTQMVVWGGLNSILNTGGRYDPATDSWTPTSTGANVPLARYDHTAVWTGTEMVVWGGVKSQFLNTGGRYNPATDSWTTTSIGVNVPAGRYGHTAVWTGSKMIVWGGYNPSFLNTGGLYDPVTDSWTPTSTGANVPTGRQRHTAVWNGTRMVIWGGYNNSSSAFNTGGQYDPVSDSWTPTSTGASTPVERQFHTAVWTGTEMIVWGGDNGSYLNTGGRYEAATDSWIPTSTGAGVPVARYGHTALWTGSEMIVIGGYNGSYLNTGGRYDPATNSWTATSTGANVPAARSGHTAVWTGTQMIVWGGYDGSVLFNTGGRYDPTTDSWTATSTGGNVPAARHGHTAVWRGSDMIVWGGYNNTYLNTGGRYDPATDSWTPTSTGANVPSAREDHTAVWTGIEMIVWGGYGWGEGGWGTTWNTGGRYDPSTDSWIPTSTGANVPDARQYHTAIWSGSEMIVWGGLYIPSPYPAYPVNTGGRFNPATDSWTATSTGADVPVSRQYHTAVWTGAEMLVWGGNLQGQLSTGGGYCACPSGQPVYRDADGDGYGNAAVSVPSCDGSTPVGYVLDHTDCDDTNSAVHPGAPEECGGIDYDCNGIIGDGGSASCNDGNVCTVDACTNGVCTWLSVCDDGLPCTDDLGDVSNNCACSHTVSSLGSVCDDGNACTLGTTCDGVGGAVANCTGGATLNCDDGNLCTDDSCDPAGGCVHASNINACDDGNACTTGDTCGGGTCNPGNAVSCNDNNLCTDDSCNPATGCVHTLNAARCTDGNSCTDDSCDPATGCLHTNNVAPCNDGNACTSIDVCSGGTCNGGSSPNCNDNNPCTNDSCNPATGCVHANNTNACDDGNVCTTSDRCGGGVCNAGAAISCYDGNVCTDDFCDAVNGCQPINNSETCDDGNLCTLNDACAGGTCHAGPLVVCNDSNPCTTDTCFPNMGCVSSANTDPCDDGNACTLGDTCGGGYCHNGTVINAPPETQNMLVAADKATSTWSSAPGATRYDVVRGSTGAFPVGPGGGDETCFDNLPGPTLTDATVPIAGTGFWYLSRGENACGIGTFGRQSDGSLRTTATCP